MQLLKVQMRNFRRFRHEDVVFRDGITGILGNNGTGKSTIVEAILFCLYGVKETGLEYILSATAGPRDRAEVRLDFSVRGDEYQIVRSLGPRKKHEAQLNRGKMLLAKGVSEVQEALRGIVRMGQADFRHTIYSGQRELLALLDATPEGRKQWFRKVLGIESLKEKGGEILRVEAAAARDRMLLARGRLAGVDPDVLRSKGEELAARAARNDVTIRAEEGRLRDAGDRRRILEEEIQRLRALEREVLQMRAGLRSRQEELARVGEEQSRIAREIGNLGGMRDEYRRLEAAEPACEELRTRLEAARAGKLRSEALLAQEARAKALLGDLQASLEREKEEEVSLLRDEERLEALRPAVARRAQALASLEALGGLESRFHALSASLAKREEALAAAARRGAEIRDRMGRAREALGRLEALADPYRARVPGTTEPVAVLESLTGDLLGQIARCRATREHALTGLIRLEGDLSALEGQGTDGNCPTCRQPLGERYRDIMAGIEEEMAALRKQISSADTAASEAVAEREHLEALLGEARRLREEGNRIPDLAGEWEGVQEMTRRELAGKEELEQELATLAYDPAERRRLEGEVASLEPAWREQVAISDRLGRRPVLVRRIQEHGETLAQLRRELVAMEREREGLGFDAARLQVLEEESASAMECHRRFLGMKADMDRLPHLEERAAELAARSGELTGERAWLEETIRGTPYSAEVLASREAALQSVLADVAGAMQEIARLGAEQGHLREEQARLSGILEAFSRDRGEHDRLNEEIALLELTRDQLNGFTDHLLGIVRDQIQEETGRILAEITDGRYDTVILDDSFELLVHDLGGDFPVSRFSGGEQDDVAIALRIALSRYIAEMHELRDSTFLIFDEIFGSQDEERRGNIFRALRALEPYFPQIFLISHVADIQGEFGNTLVVEAVSPSESRVRDLGEAEA